MSDPSKKIGIVADHAGYALKNVLVQDLRQHGYDVEDFGTHSEDRVDYPDFGHLLAKKIEAGEVARGIAVCGTGIGIGIALNRHPAVRAAVCHDVTTALLARQHNDANVLVLGGRIIGTAVAKDCATMFLETGFDGGRHADRVKKLGEV